MRAIAGREDSIPLVEFKNFVNRKINKWNVSASSCNVPYEEQGVQYHGADIWERAYIQHFGLDSESFLK